jgi:two-component system chemotaxis sensor kinase CheA
VPALIVTTDRQRFAIPQANVVELLAIGEGELDAVREAVVYRLRDRLVPVVPLAAAFGSAAKDRSTGSLVVVQADDRTFGVLVDGLSDSVEIVVKPLGPHLSGLDVFAGATILGDGSVAAIVDVVGLAGRVGIGQTHRPRVAETEPTATRRDGSSLLLFADRSGARMAVPLDDVERLEAFPRASIDRSGLADAVRYGDRILRLASVDELLVDRRRDVRYTDEELSDDVQVLVHRDGETLLGVVVGRIIDVVDRPLELEPGSRPGVRGTVVLDGRVTEVLDLPALIANRAASLGQPEEVAS